MAAEQSIPAYRFGDLLALARLSWVAQMAGRLASLGYDDYRRSDAAVMRLLARGPLSIGGLGRATGVTRQAARKLVAGLERRGFARAERDRRDSRRINVRLTPAGEAYARAVVEAIDDLNRALCERVDPGDLARADRVLRAVLLGSQTQPLADEVPPPRGER